MIATLFAMNDSGFAWTMFTFLVIAGLGFVIYMLWDEATVKQRYDSPEFWEKQLADAERDLREAELKAERLNRQR